MEKSLFFIPKVFKCNNMKWNHLMTIILPLFPVSGVEKTANSNIPLHTTQSFNMKPTNVMNIPLPVGFKRVNFPDTSFAAWLRKIPIKKDSLVHLFNGKLKINQAAQYAVLDI